MRYSSFVRGVLVGAALVSSSALQANIFGDDQRKSVSNSDEFPFNAVGKLDNGCTAELVGPDLILTTAHCFLNGNTGAVRTDIGYFQIGFRQGTADEKARVEKAWVGTFNPTDYRGKDWAIAKLSKTIKPSLRRLKLQAVDLSKATFPFAVSLTGFSKDLDDYDGLTVHRNCSLRAYEDGVVPLKDAKIKGTVLNDCHSYAGISGGMLFQKSEDGEERIVAIAVSENRDGAATSVHRDVYSDQFANFATPIADAIPVFTKVSESLAKGQDPGRVDGAFEITIRGGSVTSTSCGSFQDATGTIAFAPLDANQKTISDRSRMEAFARSKSGDGMTPNIQALVRERGGSLAYGLTNAECQKAITFQNNALICSAGLSYNIFRVTDGIAVNENFSGESFASFDECVKAVRFSTSKHVCTWIDAVRMAAISLEGRQISHIFSALIDPDAQESCLRWIRNQ